MNNEQEVLMAVPKAIQEKMARLRSGESPRYMDLFSGCGGISLGFVTAGFQPVASVEVDAKAAASHGANFARFSVGTNHTAHFKARDITQESPASIFKDIGIAGPVDRQIDVLVGGPPCQAFARVGRAKLRHEARKREEITAETAFLADGRVNLWKRYMAYVQDTKPLAILMENVPDILNHGGTNVAELVAEELRKDYIVRYTLLNASWYGVPQTRERMFLIALHKALGTEVRFPEPTHFTELPSGYEGARATARKFVPRQAQLDIGIEHGHHWMKDPKPDAGLPRTTTAREALADLPPIRALDLYESGDMKGGQKNPGEQFTYTSEKPSTSWSRLMRQWPGFSARDHGTGHVIRYLPRDYKIFRVMKEGWQYPDVWRFVEDKRMQLLEELRHKSRHADRAALEERITKDWTLPYDPKKFPNKWWKLYRDKPVRTLMAHLGKDSYSHIHFDSDQARPISVREAARLQSFPDGFELRGAMNAAFKQIGNAVPPLVAYAIAREIRSSLGCRELADMREVLLLPRRRAGDEKEEKEQCIS
jgi:DNA (cytosine-5)-methyltransferase 1